MEYGCVRALGRKSKLAAYQSVSVHGAVDDADPHGLVLMLMDGAVERMTTARGCLARGEMVRKTKLLHSSITLIAELRGCLDMARGGAIAQNLSDLYDYMLRQLLRANVENNSALIGEVLSLLSEIRSAWVAIGPEVRQMQRTQSPNA
jgi:flagellar protein FliS